MDFPEDEERSEKVRAFRPPHCTPGPTLPLEPPYRTCGGPCGPQILAALMNVDE
jgi:hypothetical protein